MRRRALALRPGELVVLGVGLVAVAVAGVTWAHATPWSSRPVTAAMGAAAPVSRVDPPLGVTTAAGVRPVEALDPTETADVTAHDSAPDATTAPAAPSVSAAADPTTSRPAPPRRAAVPIGTASTGRAPGAGATGRMCLVLAPDAAFGAGHNGWAFRQADGTWVEGATENNTPNELVSAVDGPNDDGSFYVEPGGETDSWMRTVATFAQVRADFRNRLSHRGRLLHDAGYYTTLRCGDLPSADPAAAYRAARAATASGYFVGTDNCITKAVDILHAYGAHLPDASFELPADYMTWRLAPLGPATRL